MLLGCALIADAANMKLVWKNRRLWADLANRICCCVVNAESENEEEGEFQEAQDMDWWGAQGFVVDDLEELGQVCSVHAGCPAPHAPGKIVRLAVHANYTILHIDMHAGIRSRRLAASAVGGPFGPPAHCAQSGALSHPPTIRGLCSCGNCYACVQYASAVDGILQHHPNLRRPANHKALATFAFMIVSALVQLWKGCRHHKESMLG